MSNNMDNKLREIVSQEVLFAREAAQFLNISMQRLNQLVHAGQLEPLKKSSAGTLFLKKDLEERKKLLENIAIYLPPAKEMKKLKVNTSYLNEAVNYFTIQALCGYSDKKAEPIFKEISKKLDLTQPLTKYTYDIAQILNTNVSTIDKLYENTMKGFEKLNNNDFIVKKGTNLYPTLLNETNEAPPYLFMRGNVDLLNEKIVSVVGTRNPSNEGRERAYRLSKLLGRYGIVVASGLARGIDTAAHTAALDNNQFTIAVIGTPITRVYPKENEKLQKQISEKGLVISQFAPSAPVQRWYFPMRNGVMSGISLATAVIEAGETSGALKQADYALKQGRIVFIPQSALDNPNITWPKKYIKRPGAVKFSKIEDLLFELKRSKIIVDPANYQFSLFSEGVESLHVHRVE
jgi:DNA processing protein